MRNWELNQEQFYGLLRWLDADEEVAAKKYLLIQLRLVRFFASRGCIDAENLADKTINVVASKVNELDGYVGDRSLYFHGVAKFIHLQSVRDDRHPFPPPVQPSPDPIVEVMDACLEECLNELPSGQRDLVMDYEQEEKQARIQRRKRIAEELGITVNALRIKIYRIHLQLRKCLELRLEEVPAH